MFEPITQLTDAQTEELTALYQGEWWCRDRRLEDVRRMLERTDLIVAFREQETGRLAAFARVLTDYVYRATVYDVIVAADHRGTGLGRRLIQAVLAHPDLELVEIVGLHCLPDLVPFYQQLGLSEDRDGLRTMQRRRPLNAE